MENKEQNHININSLIKMNSDNIMDEEFSEINDFDAPENAEYVEIQIEHLVCGNKKYIRQIKNYYHSDGSVSYIVKIDGVEK